MLDLSIVNGKVFMPGDGFLDLEVGIQSGKVVMLAGAHGLPESKTTLDAGGRIVMPGAIDPHIHLGIMADFNMECETESRAALAGGVTTAGVFMGGGESYLSQLDSLIETIEKKSSIDLFFHLSIFTDEQLSEMETCYSRFGVTSFKFYMAGVRGVFPGVTDGFILEGFKKIAAMGDRALACVHCEDQSMLDIAFDRVADSKSKGTLADWADTAPNIAEEEAIMRACFLAEKAGNRLYIVHISTKEGSGRFAAIRREGTARVYGETTSAYLSVSKHDPVGLLAKMLPPLRDQSDVNALWERVRENVIDSFGTDNVSMSREAKQADKGMMGAMPGYPILQTHLPALITEGYHKRGVSLDTILTRATVNPAKIFGLYPQKGALQVGSDADVVVLDVNKEWEVNSDQLFSYGNFSIFEGKTLAGWPETVVKSGEIAYQNGEITVAPGIGSFLRRKL